MGGYIRSLLCLFPFLKGPEVQTITKHNPFAIPEVQVYYCFSKNDLPFLRDMFLNCYLFELPQLSLSSWRTNLSFSLPRSGFFPHQKSFSLCYSSAACKSARQTVFGYIHRHSWCDVLPTPYMLLHPQPACLCGLHLDQKCSKIKAPSNNQADPTHMCKHTQSHEHVEPEPTFSSDVMHT